MQENTYNGWTNYATWRVMLEMGFGDRNDWAEMFNEKPEPSDLGDVLKEETADYIEQICDATDGGSLVHGWAQAFVDDANFDEMAKNILLDWDD